MLVKALAVALDVEYKFANFIVQQGLNISRLSLPEVTRTALIDRVYRLRLDTRLMLNVMWLTLLLFGLPLEFKIWDLESQIWILKFFIPIFKFLAYWRGFLEGTSFGLGVAFAHRKLTNWIDLQRQKSRVYYLLYRCKAI